MIGARYGFCVALILLIMGLLGVQSAKITGQTVDETFYSAGGYPIVRYNNYEFLGDHPPLISQLAGLPLLFLKPNFPIHDPLYVPGTDRNDVSRNGARFLYKMGNDPRLILLLERLPIVFLTLLLGLCLALMAREIYGSWGSLLALFLYAFTPDILAHGSLFTTDMGITAFYFISIYALKRFFDVPTASRAALFGLCCGLTFMSKITGLILFPIALFLWTQFWFEKGRKISLAPLSEKFDSRLGFIAIFILVNAVGQKQAMVSLGPLALLAVYLCVGPKAWIAQVRWRELLLKVVLAALFCLSIFFSIKLKKKYGVKASVIFIFWNLGVLAATAYLSRMQQNESLIRFVKLFLSVWLIAGLVIILGYTDFAYKCYRFIGFGNFVKPLGIAYTHAIGGVGHRLCVDGSFVTCDWRYFFCVLAVKLPVLLIVLFLMGLIFLLASKVPLLTKTLILLPPGLLFLAAVFNKINIGVRHILPVYPFFCLIAGFVGAWIANRWKGLAKAVLVVLLMAGLILMAVRTLQTAPDFLAYFNEAVGGADRGADLVSDSNLNWGQDNMRLAEWVRDQNIPLIKINSHAINADVYEFYKINWKYLNDADYVTPAPGYYALGIESYRNLQLQPDSWFYKREPFFRAGRTFYVFKVPETVTETA